MTRLSYVHGASHTWLVGSTIGAFFDQIVAEHGANEAVVSRPQGVRYTYDQLHAEVERIARGLLALGIEKGDRVGIWSPNNIEWVIVQYATTKIGAILVNINPAYRTHELKYALQQSGVSLLVTAPGFRTTDYIAAIEEIRPALPELKQVVVLGEAPKGSLSWTDLLSRAEETSVDSLHRREAILEFDDPINIQYTSGTTGFPKGATLSHHNILNNGYLVAQRLRLTPEDRVCMPVPFYHCFGMVLGNLGFMTHGATVVIPGEAFDAQLCLEAVQEEACTAIYGVPTMFIAMLEHPAFESYRLSTLRTGIMAGAPCPVDLPPPNWSSYKLVKWSW